MTNSLRRGDTPAAETYDETYFQGNQVKSNYTSYAEASYGPTRMLAETLYRFFRPASVLDMGCAVGHPVKRLRELGCEAYGVDVSTWAIKYANAPYCVEFDAAWESIPRQFDLVYSYDVVEHIHPDRLEYAARNLWRACTKDLLVVPEVYENGEASDPNEPTHLTFWSRQQWIDFFVERIGCRFDEEASARFAKEEHSLQFHYAHRIMIFSKLSFRNNLSEI